MSELELLCRERAGLPPEDVSYLAAVEKQLPLIAELTGADVFLDCVLDEKTALVVAQARPAGGISAYEKYVVGELAGIEREPAVFHAFRSGTAVCDLKAMTQENRAVRQNAAPVKNGGHRVIGILIREKDISGALQQERKYEALARSREEERFPGVENESGRMRSEAALREIHHRVKNNLQLVASILDLQARRSGDAGVKKILQGNVSRILSIAAIHDILTHNANDIRSVGSGMLLERIRRNLQALAPLNKRVRLSVRGDEVFMTADTATSVALVITELVTNAVQHAFPDRDAGRVTVCVCAGTLYHTVVVSDDGIGFDWKSAGKNRLGLSIVESTVRERLKGRFRIESDGKGTTAAFDFKRE